MNSNRWMFFILVLTIFISLLFIINQNDRYDLLSLQEKQLTNKLQHSIKSYKENLYRIEKLKIQYQQNSKNKVDILYVQ